LMMKRNGGFHLHSPHQAEDFKNNVLGLIKREDGSTDVDFPELNFVYKNAVNSFGPDDYFLLWKSVRTKDAFPSHILTLLRLSNHDPDLFFRFRNTLLEKADNSPYLKEILKELDLVWDHYYPNGVHEEEYIAFSIGRIMFKSGEFGKALVYFEESLKIDQEDQATYYNIGLCKEYLGFPHEALMWYNKSLVKKPDFQRALKKRDQLRDFLKRKERNQLPPHNTTLSPPLLILILSNIKILLRFRSIMKKNNP